MKAAFSMGLICSIAILVACASGTADRNTLRAKNAAEFISALRASKYIVEAKVPNKREPGVILGRATNRQGQVAKFVLSVVPKAVDIVNRYPNAYDSSSIYDGRDPALFFVVENYPKKGISRGRLYKWYDMLDDLEDIQCRVLSGTDCGT